MARYHISPHTGDPGVCNAKVNCPYGNLETDHFDSPEEARAAYEAGNLDQAFTTLRKALDAVTDDAFASALDYPEGRDGAKSEDDLLLEGIERAGWPAFDPSRGPEQFDEYHVGGSDYPALTDEAMDEMGAAIDAADQKYRTVRSYFDYDEDDNPFYSVEVSEYGEFLTDDPDIVKTAERVAEAGEWGELETWDEDVTVKLRYVNRYLNKPDALGYIADAKLDNEDKLAEIGDEDSLSAGSKRFRVHLDNALLDVAERTLRSEEDAKAAAAMLPQDANPPF